MTCKRAQEFLAKKKMLISEQVDAKKVRIGGAAAVKLARSVNKLWVAKGKKCVQIDLKKRQSLRYGAKEGLVGTLGKFKSPDDPKRKRAFRWIPSRRVWPPT